MPHSGAAMRAEDEPKIRSEVVARVVDHAFAAAALPGGRPVAEVINETLYHERERLREAADEPRTRADRSLYSRLRRELPSANDAAHRRMLHRVVAHYVDEICGHFDPRVYEVSTKVLPLALGGLLNGLSPTRLAR